VSDNTLYVHLPSVALREATDLSFGAGHLVELPFEAWLQLDAAFDGMRALYAAARPVFYVQAVPDSPADPNGDDTADIFASKIADDLHTAFVLSTGEVPPPPALSVRYIRVPSGTVQRRIGPGEREYIIHNETPLVILDQQAAYAAAAFLSLVQRKESVLAVPPLSNLQATLRRRGMPGFDSLDGIIHCVVALESILVDVKVHQHRAELVIRRCAALVSDRNNFGAWIGALRALYQLRNKALHGLDFTADLQDHGSVDAQYALARTALIRSCAGVLALFDSAGQARRQWSKLHDQLDEAALGSDALSNLIRLKELQLAAG
jgi:hypothetical protein